jgi:hypothetical protein
VGPRGRKASKATGRLFAADNSTPRYAHAVHVFDIIVGVSSEGTCTGLLVGMCAAPQPTEEHRRRRICGLQGNLGSQVLAAADVLMAHVRSLCASVAVPAGAVHGLLLHRVTHQPR